MLAGRLCPRCRPAAAPGEPGSREGLAEGSRPRWLQSRGQAGTSRCWAGAAHEGKHRFQEGAQRSLSRPLQVSPRGWQGSGTAGGNAGGSALRALLGAADERVLDGRGNQMHQ